MEQKLENMSYFNNGRVSGHKQCGSRDRLHVWACMYKCTLLSRIKIYDGAGVDGRKKSVVHTCTIVNTH